MTRFQLIQDDLFCRTNDGSANATGHLEGNEVLVVHSRSTAMGDWRTNKRMLDQCVVEPLGNGFRFLVDFAFPSAHAASEFVLGDTRPIGWDSWKNRSGKTLRQLFEASGWLWLIEGSPGVPHSAL